MAWKSFSYNRCLLTIIQLKAIWCHRDVLWRSFWSRRWAAFVTPWEPDDIPAELSSISRQTKNSKHVQRMHVAALTCVWTHPNPAWAFTGPKWSRGWIKARTTKSKTPDDSIAVEKNQNGTQGHLRQFIRSMRYRRDAIIDVSDGFAPNTESVHSWELT